MLQLILLALFAFSCWMTKLALTATQDREGAIQSILGGFIGFFSWGMVAFGSLHVDVATSDQNDPIKTFTYPSLTLFAAGMGVMCVVLAYYGPFELLGQSREAGIEDL